MATLTLATVTRDQPNTDLDGIFRQHYQLIYRTAFGLTGRSEDAEDVLQTIFLRLLGREFPPDLITNPRAYFYRAAVNVSLNVIRSRKGQVQIVDADALAAVDESESEGADETQKRLLNAISQLNTGAVEIVMLRYVHDYSDAQIAKMLGTTRGTVAVSLYRSRARIKKLMRGSGENL